MQIEHDDGLLGLGQLRVDRLTDEDGVQVLPGDGRPDDAVLDDVAGVVLELVVDDQAVDEPADGGLGVPAHRPAGEGDVVALLVGAHRAVQQAAPLVQDGRRLGGHWKGHQRIVERESRLEGALDCRVLQVNAATPILRAFVFVNNNNTYIIYN